MRQGALIAFAILACMPAVAQSQERGLSPAAVCVQQVLEQNQLSSDDLRTMQSGQLVQIYGFRHALAEGENVSALCERLQPLQQQNALKDQQIRAAQEAQAAAESRQQAVQDQLNAIQTDWFKANPDVGWFLATIGWFAFFGLVALAWVSSMKKRKRRFGNGGSFSFTP